MCSRLLSRRVVGIVWVAALLLLPACSRFRSAEENGAPIPVEQEQHHRLVLENNYVRVYRAELAPEESMPVHRHMYDYLAVYLTPGELNETSPGEPARAIRHGRGEVRFARAPLAHGVTNTSSSPSRVIIVELKKAPASGSAAQPSNAEHSLDLGHGHVEEQLLDNERVRVTDVQIAPGMHSDEEESANPQLLLWMESGELSTHNGEEIRGNQGEVSWLNANPGMFHNTGANQAHIVIVQLK